MCVHVFACACVLVSMRGSCVCCLLYDGCLLETFSTVHAHAHTHTCMRARHPRHGDSLEAKCGSHEWRLPSIVQRQQQGGRREERGATLAAGSPAGKSEQLLRLWFRGEMAWTAATCAALVNTPGVDSCFLSPAPAPSSPEPFAPT